MRKLFMAGTMMFIAASAAGSGSLCAQIKLAVFDPSAGEPASGIKGVAFEPAKEAADFKHGTLLALTLKDGTKVIGTMVRSEPKTKRIFVRTNPGAVPVAYTEADLKQVEKATRPISA